MTNQERAQEIASALHKAHRQHRQAGKALDELHELLRCHAEACGGDLGIDVAPLSAGGEKPPRPQ